MIRRLRKLFGSDGIIVCHDTSLGTPVATVPNIDAYFDATHNGERIPFKSANDPYIRYQVRKYGISNTVGMWLADDFTHITKKEFIDALIAMNARRCWNGYAFWRRAIPDATYRYYLKRLERLKRAYLTESQSNPG